MPLGLFSFNTEYSIRPDRFARAAEDRQKVESRD